MGVRGGMARGKQSEGGSDGFELRMQEVGW